MKVVLFVLLSLFAIGCLAQLECSQDADCQDNEFCNRDYSCGATTGSCMTVPEICMEIYQPVCGCDGRTHGNACSAYSNRVSVDTDGECDYFVTLDDIDTQSAFTDLLEPSNNNVETSSTSTETADAKTHEDRSHHDRSHDSHHQHHHSHHDASSASLVSVSVAAVMAVALLF